MKSIKTTTQSLLLLLGVGTTTIAAGAAAPPGMSFDTWTYVPDPVGNILSRDDGTDTTTYGYDTLDRLINEIGPTHTDDYSYDANGNREDFARDGGQPLDYLIDAVSNRLDQVGTETRTHDAAGNTTADRSGSRTFTYNDAGRLTQVHENSQLIATYTYNALGQRVTKTTPSGTTYYLYDSSGQLMGEYDQSGQPIKEYVHLNDEPIAQLDSHITYLHTDHLGTPRRATDDTGQVIWKWDSEAFGNQQAEQDPDQNGQATTVNLRFPGQQYDEETGLYYNYFRYYDASIGRYITSDPIGLNGGLNTYAYVGGNPLRYTDIFGLKVVCKPVVIEYYDKTTLRLVHPERGYWSEVCFPVPVPTGGLPDPGSRRRPGFPSPLDIAFEKKCVREWVMTEPAEWETVTERWMKWYLECTDTCTGEKTTHWAPDRPADDFPNVN